MKIIHLLKIYFIVFVYKRFTVTNFTRQQEFQHENEVITNITDVRNKFRSINQFKTER